MADMIKIRSTTDSMVSLYDPMVPFRKMWPKRGAIVPVEREKAIQMYYNGHLERAILAGLLAIDDKNFLCEVGLISEETETPPVFELTETIMEKCIGNMQLWEFKKTLEKLSKPQIDELAEYAIVNHTKLKMDRIDLLSKVSGKNILKAIELYKAAQED